MSDWSPSLYARFEDERTRPARDLVAQVPLNTARRIVDMGCGPGNSTELLVARWPEAATVGLDTSPAMLDEARKRLPQASFALADANTCGGYPKIATVIEADLWRLAQAPVGARLRFLPVSIEAATQALRTARQQLDAFVAARNISAGGLRPA